MKNILKVSIGFTAILFVIAFPSHTSAQEAFNAAYFSNNLLSGTPTFNRTETQVDYDWVLASPDSSLPVDNFSARWSGVFTFEEGTYVFTTLTDDGVRLYIDGQVIIDKWNLQAPTQHSQTLNLSAGQHTVVMEYFESGGGALAQLSWGLKVEQNLNGQKIMPLGDSITDGLYIPGGYRIKLSELITNFNFVGTQQNGPASLADRDHQGHSGWKIADMQNAINGFLGAGNPEIILLMLGSNDMGLENEWQTAPQRLAQLLTTITDSSQADVIVASIPPMTQSYSNINYRVEQYNQAIPGVVQQLKGQGRKIHFLDMNSALTESDLIDGIHPNQAGYDAMAEVWATAIHQVRNTQPTNSPVPTNSPTPTNNPQVGYQAEYFNNITLSGTPTVTKQTNSLFFDWGYGSPDPLITSDYFSARWSTVEPFAASNYTFTVTADDGVRLYIDGQMIIDKWIDQPPTTYTITKAMTEGEHEIVMEYYEKQVGAVAKLEMSIQEDTPTPTPSVSPSPAIPLDNGFQAQYFNNIQLTGTPVLSRVETAVYNDWVLSSPHATVPEDYFSARWTGDITFDPNNYTFSVTADDGVRLYIDDELIIDKWLDQAPTTYTFNKQLNGVHRVRVEYYEKTYGAVAKLTWQVASASPTPTEGGQSTDDGNGTFSAQFFNNLTLEGSPAYSFTTNYIAYGWGYGSPHQSVQVDNFSGRFIGAPEFEAGLYRFRVIADDGIKIWINDALVLDQWQDQAQTFEFDQRMEAGEHTVKVEYYEKGIGAALDIFWEKIE